jgi:hypothetical protein
MIASRSSRKLGLGYYTLLMGGFVAYIRGAVQEDPSPFSRIRQNWAATWATSSPLNPNPLRPAKTLPPSCKSLPWNSSRRFSDGQEPRDLYALKTSFVFELTRLCRSSISVDLGSSKCPSLGFQASQHYFPRCPGCHAIEPYWIELSRTYQDSVNFLMCDFKTPESIHVASFYRIKAM